MYPRTRELFDSLPDGDPRRDQMTAWWETVDKDVLAAWFKHRDEVTASNYKISCNLGLRDAPLECYKPTHCDCCGKPLPGDKRPAIMWGYDAPRAECKECWESNW